MFRKKLLFLSLPFLFITVSVAQSTIECRVAVGGISKCSPYSLKFVKAKEIKYDKDRHKLIVEKTLPIPPKKPLKVISVEEMIEKYVKIEEPIRYKGTTKKLLLKKEKKEEVFPKEKIYSRIENLKIQREKLLEKMRSIKEENEKKHKENLKKIEKKEKNKPLKIVKNEEKKEKIKGFYTVEKGDSLSFIAKKFGIKTKLLTTLNNLKNNTAIKIGQKLILPFSQKRIDSIAKAEYIVEPGDNIGSIAQDFNLSTLDIIKFNNIKKSKTIRIGQKLRLPLPYKVAEVKKKLKKESTNKHLARKKSAKKKKKLKTVRFLHGFGKRKLRVTATAYSSHKAQTDKTPFLAAWNNRIRPGMKIIAVSRDMLTRYGLRNGSKVKIGGLSGYYTVRDKMNKRFRKRIDIYMGINRRRALRWGRRSVVISW